MKTTAQYNAASKIFHWLIVVMLLIEFVVYAHVLTAAGVAGLIGLHVLAALFHYYFLKDKVLQRMLPQV
jgi:cytochrome b561